ncbi:MAG: TonB-dependent receptor, partial [Burkholderiales bacterium]|nr:TonB-dependent receptor [Burkholderiales bacterium]
DYQLKQARMQGASALQVAVGEHAFVRSTLDIGAGLHSASGNWAGRAVLAAQGGRSEPGALPQGRDNLLLTGSWSPSARQQFSIDLEQQHDRSPFSFGTVIDNGLDNSPGVHIAHVRYDQVYIVPDGAPTKRSMDRAAVRWRHELGAGWVAQAVAQTVRVFRDETLLGFWTLLSPSELSGYYTKYADHYRQDNLRLQIGGVAHGRLVDHHLNAGLDLNHDAWLFTGVQNIGGFRIGVDRPDFSAVNPADLAVSPRYNAETQRDSGVWIDDEMQVSPSWFIDAGARRARYEIAADRSGAGLLEVAHSAATVHQAGLRWQAPAGDAAWRLAWNEGLQANRGETHEGSFLPPQRTAGIETGATLIFSPAAKATINAWRTDLQDLAMRDPHDRNAYISTGSRRVLGIEASGSWRRGRWTVHGQASALAMRQLVPTTSNLGDQFVGVARRLAGLRAEWKDDEAQRWWLSLSGVGPRFADAANRFLLPGYVKADAGIERRLSPHLRLGFTLRNLSDLRYVSGVSAVDNVYQGSRRSAFLTLRLGG